MKLKFVLSIGVTLCLALLLIPSAAIAGETVTVSIDAPAEVLEGSDFSAKVVISEVTDFDTCGFDVVYDETVIHVTGVTGGKIGETTVPVDLWNTVDTGRTRVATNIVGVPGVSGTGYLAEIHFNVVGSACESSTIDLEGVGMYDCYANPIATTTVGDSVHVCALPEITTTELPEGKVDDAYSATLEASGGKLPYTWEVTGLPAGLSCSTAGVISGTPTVAFDSTVTAKVTDDLGNFDSKNLALKIYPALVLTTTELPEGKVGDAYSATLEATGGKLPHTWEVTGLPTGLTCSAAGVISGTPTADFDSTVTATVTDSFSTPNTATKQLALKIYKVGDANGDGKVDMGDVTKVERIFMTLDTTTPGADANGDKVVDMGDVTAVERIYLEL